MQRAVRSAAVGCRLRKEGIRESLQSHKLPYNLSRRIYNEVMSSVDYVMTVSGNGQVSIPAEVRARWRADARVVAGKVRIVDLGDRVVVAPVFEDPIAALRGKYSGRGPRVDDARRRGRVEDNEVDSRKQTRGGSRQHTR